MTAAHRGWHISEALFGYSFQHPGFDPENATDWRHGHAATVQDAREEIDRLLADDAEWSAASNLFALHPNLTRRDQLTDRREGSPFTEADHARLVIRDDVPPTVHARWNKLTERWESPVAGRESAS